MTVATISEFRANVKRYVDEVINNSGSLVINRGEYRGGSDFSGRV